MEFDLASGRAVIERTPRVLDALLRGLPVGWTMGTEGPDTWSPQDVLRHLIHGERTNWMPRVEHLMTHGDAVAFPAFDRVASDAGVDTRGVGDLLDGFAIERANSLRRLDALGLTGRDLERPGRHPAFGPVRLGELLATWVAHDLDHLVQIARVMGWQYAGAVGPWREYLRVARPL